MSPVLGWQEPAPEVPAGATESVSEAPERGQALVEYIFTIMFVALVAITGLRTMGPKLNDFFASLTF
ncbi:MAG: Flp family type IVb pilin [Symbiobacteriia bacterium]